MVSLNIKNSGKTYPIELALSDTGLVFKQKINAATHIPIERQKVLLKTGQLKDDVLVESLGLKEGQMIMVLGSPVLNLPVAPTNAVFLEDLKDEDLHFSSDPIGLQNLGNTCYLNSSIQALAAIPKVNKTLQETTKSGALGSDEHLVQQLKTVVKQLDDKKRDSVTPGELVSSLRAHNPMFSERDPMGMFKQQDAEEAFTLLLRSLEKVAGDDFIQNFTIRFKSVIKNTEDESDVEERADQDLKLQCHINGTTNFLKSGLLESLSDTLDKRSARLEKDCVYEVQKTITKLPTILTVQFVRFFWKRSTNKKSKILRKVTFPFQLDLADMLDAEYREDKVKIRDELRSVEKVQQNEDREFKKQKRQLLSKEEDEFDEKQHKKFAEQFKAKFPQDLASGENPSSLYNLTAVITHQGTSADSGHYQAFVKDKYNENRWWRFNDDKVSIVDKERVEGLAGGGESDSALILIYKGFGLE